MSKVRDFIAQVTDPDEEDYGVVIMDEDGTLYEITDFEWERKDRILFVKIGLAE